MYPRALLMLAPAGQCAWYFFCSKVIQNAKNQSKRLHRQRASYGGETSITAHSNSLTLLTVGLTSWNYPNESSIPKPKKSLPYIILPL